MLKLDLTRSAVSFLENLPAKQYKQILKKVISLSTDLTPHDSKPIKGNEGFWRTDIGEYRVSYKVVEDVLKVAVIDKRNDDAVYKILSRKL